MRDVVLRRVEVDGVTTNVRLSAGTVTEIGGVDGAQGVAEVIDGGGGALIPGLWDHHIHLMALAAARDSVSLGPPTVTTRSQLAMALADADRSRPPGTWLRGVGYHESVAGNLDRGALDQFVGSRPLRVQHRSGALWMLNSSAVVAVGLDGTNHSGIERDRDGHPTGRLFGADRWLRERTGGEPPPLGPVGRVLTSRGVVGVTDATPYETAAELSLLAEGLTANGGVFRPHVVATGGPPLADAPFPPPLARGPVKIIVADHDLPELSALAGMISAAHACGRPVAVHIVTRVALVLALAAWETAGAELGDRIEHGSVIPSELYEPIRRLGLTVVTQPNFVYERGDEYLADVESDDRADLYPCASLLTADIAVAGSTDAPFGEADPWLAIVAAARRRTRTGARLSLREAVVPRRALELFLGAPESPGGPVRRVSVGARANLCLLDAPVDVALADPHDEHVAATIIDGEIVYRR